jgi:hypothetical protein
MENPQRDIPEERTDADQPSVARRGFLKAGAGVVSATAGLAAISGSAAAHFPEKLDIDIKPGSEKNRIILGSEGVIPVAVLQTEQFDPTNKEVHYRFGAPDVVNSGGGARPVYGGQSVDVNDDGRTDLILHFPAEETGFTDAEETGILVWERHQKGSEHGLSGTGPVTTGVFLSVQTVRGVLNVLRRLF